MNGDLSWSLVRASRLRPDAAGIVDGSRVVTYAELARRVGALGGALDLLGVGRGARVGILASNSLAHVECFIGVPSFGRVVVSLNVRLAEEELAFIVDDAEIAALITDAEHLPVARALADRCSSLVNVVVAGEQSAPTDCVSYEGLIEASPVLALGGAESGLAAVSYTGGTTSGRREPGRPVDARRR
jgi:long-chain acyl-CoA synthetase